MASRAVSLSLDEGEILDIQKIAAVFNTTFTNVVREALSDYLPRKKEEPYYRLTAGVAPASPEESAEVLDALEGLSDDDLAVSSVRRFLL